MQSLETLRRLPTADYVATVIHSISLTPTIKAIRLRLDRDEFSFLPGQSVWPKFERDGRKFSKIYSIASSPSACPEIELCVSRVGWSSAVVQDLEVGESLPLRGPYGLMTLSELPQRPRLYIAEGSGIAPLKSQIDWLYECGYKQPVWLIQANPETPDQLPYQHHWQQLQKGWNAFHYHEVIDQCPEALLARRLLKLSEVDVVICAVGDRSDHLQEVVLALGGKPDHVRSEKFIAF